MSLSDEVTRGIEQVRQDRRHGAGWLSRQAIKVIGLAVEKSEAKDAAQFLEEIRAVGKQLAQSRPNMTSIGNNVCQLVRQILKESQQERNVDKLMSFARSRCDELIRYSEEAALKAAEHGAEIIANRDQVMTCSYSSIICETLKIARQKGKQFRVVVAESKSSKGTAYGELTAAQLRSYGVPAESIPDETIPHHISRVNKVMVGADSILNDGTLINGTPTYRIASAARNANIPFYSVCETSKFSALSHCGEEPELEEGFDRVPPSLMTGIITEEGTIRPWRRSTTRFHGEGLPASKRG